MTMTCGTRDDSTAAAAGSARGSTWKGTVMLAVLGGLFLGGCENLRGLYRVDTILYGSEDEQNKAEGEFVKDGEKQPIQSHIIGTDKARSRSNQHYEPRSRVCKALLQIMPSSDKITARKGKRLGYYRCRSCDEEFTVRTSTIFERSHVPLHKWIYAMYLVVTSGARVFRPCSWQRRSVSHKRPRGSYLGACVRLAAAISRCSPVS